MYTLVEKSTLPVYQNGRLPRLARELCQKHLDIRYYMYLRKRQNRKHGELWDQVIFDYVKHVEPCAPQG